MKKYIVTGLVTISVHTEVFAETAEDAIEMAQERPLQSICHYCSGQKPVDQWITSGELDGEVKDMVCDEQ